jgi:hypothetical protein
LIVGIALKNDRLPVLEKRDAETSKSTAPCNNILQVFLPVAKRIAGAREKSQYKMP